MKKYVCNVNKYKVAYAIIPIFYNICNNTRVEPPNGTNYISKCSKSQAGYSTNDETPHQCVDNQKLAKNLW